MPYTLQLVIIKHLISHIIKNDKHDFLMSELSKIIKSSANLSPANIGYVFLLPTASPLAMVKTWVSDKMPFDPTKIHWTPRIHVHQILIHFNCRTHLYWANRSIHHLFWMATPYFAWLKPSNRHSPTHYSCYHYYHSYRHYCFTAIIFHHFFFSFFLATILTLSTYCPCFSG